MQEKSTRITSDKANNNQLFTDVIRRFRKQIEQQLVTMFFSTVEFLIAVNTAP
jgi:hypothetical protein